MEPKLEALEYWPQHKVFLYAQLALFPGKLHGKALNEAESYLELAVAELDPWFFYVELKSYIKEYDLNQLTTGKKAMPESQANLQGSLLSVARNKYSKYGDTQVIDLTDIWPDPTDRDFLTTPFWELILSENLLRGNIDFINIGYEGNYKVGTNASHDMPLPFVEFRIKPGTLFHAAVAPPRLHKAPPKVQRAWLSLPEKHVIATLGNSNTYTITRQGTGLRTDLAPYSLMKYLLNHPSDTVTLEFARSSIDGCDGADDLTELVRQSGFNKKLKELFFEISVRDKIKLRQEVYLDKEGVALLAK